jgi:hypothetical protein
MSATEADLNRWIADGTLDRIAAAIEARTPRSGRVKAAAIASRMA